MNFELLLISIGSITSFCGLKRVDVDYILAIDWANWKCSLCARQWIAISRIICYLKSNSTFEIGMRFPLANTIETEMSENKAGS